MEIWIAKGQGWWIGPDGKGGMGQDKEGEWTSGKDWNGRTSRSWTLGAR